MTWKREDTDLLLWKSEGKMPMVEATEWEVGIEEPFLPTADNCGIVTSNFQSQY